MHYPPEYLASRAELPARGRQLSVTHGLIVIELGRRSSMKYLGHEDREMSIYNTILYPMHCLIGSQ